MLPVLHLPRNPAAIAGAVAGAACLVGAALWALLRHRPSREELEERRRRHLAASGRIVDGALIGAEPHEDEPAVILYRYRVAGVTYECAQDVSSLTPRVHGLRLDFPVQVRYNQANPGDSIVVAEQWNGLWHVGAAAARVQGRD